MECLNVEGVSRTLTQRDANTTVACVGRSSVTPAQGLLELLGLLGLLRLSNGDCNPDESFIIYIYIYE